MFLNKSIMYGGIPFEIRNEQFNIETLAAIQETEDILSGKVKAKEYNSAEELFEDLNIEKN